jgi:hypothetical protein
MENKAKHTPGPWAVDDNTGVFGRVDIMALQTCVAVAQAEPGKEEAEANASFIARACNSHDALLEAAKLGRKPNKKCCKNVAEYGYDVSVITGKNCGICDTCKINAAIALAEKGA